MRAGAEKSSSARVLNGIPKGSILGPILFTLFINDMPNQLLSVCKIFVDDTKLFGNAKESAKIQSDILKLQRWSDE